MKTEVLIVGSGCSGLYCALQLPRDKEITLITKAIWKATIPTWHRAESAC